MIADLTGRLMHKKKLILGVVAAFGALTAIAAGAYLFLPGALPDPLQAEPGGFSGIVVDGLTDSPIKDAQITAFDEAENAVAQAVSDIHGRFSLSLQDGDYTIQAQNPGFSLRGRDDQGRNVSVTDGTQFVNAKLRLWPTASVRGRVIAGNGGLNANVILHYQKDASGSENYDLISVQTDDNGAFQIHDAFAGMASVRIAAEGFANVELSDIALKSGASVDLGDIPMKDGVSLYGQITDATSKRGIRGATIRVKNAAGAILHETTTSTAGEFRLPPLDMIQVAVDISAEGYYAEQRRMQLAGNTNSELSVALRRAWGLVLDVQNDTGREPTQTRITILDANTQKELYQELLPNGTLSLDHLKGGPFIIQAESPDRLTHQTLRARAGESVRIRLKPFAKIIAKALDTDGSPLTQGQYRYAVKSTHDAPDESPTPWFSMASSEFELTDLAEGYYRVEIRKDSGKPASSPEFQLRNGDVRNLTIQLTEGGVLRGHVVTSVEGFNVVLATVSIEGEARNVRTDPDGYFTLDKVPDTPFTVVIQIPNESEPSRFPDIAVKENSTVEREFRVTAPRTEQREKRHARFEEMRAKGELPPRPPRRTNGGNADDATPPWGDGNPPPWGDGNPPPWGDGNPPHPDDGNPPPWGDGNPPWGDGNPPWGDGTPPWGDGNPPHPDDANPPDEKSR